MSMPGLHQAPAPVELGLGGGPVGNTLALHSAGAQPTRRRLWGVPTGSMRPRRPWGGGLRGLLLTPESARSSMGTSGHAQAAPHGRQGDYTKGLGGTRRCSQHCLLSGCAAAAGHPPHTGAFPGHTPSPCGAPKQPPSKGKERAESVAVRTRGIPTWRLCKGLSPAPHRHCWPGPE